jgi:hypothetical protein
MDDHQGIPRDTDGNPIFLILPPGLQVQYEKRMAPCERAWRAGEPLAVAEATTWTHIHRQQIPKWLEQAVVELARGRRSQRQAKQHVEARIRLQRYMTVRDLKERFSWPEAYEKAADLLKRKVAAGSADTMKADYCKVQRDLKAGRSGKYFQLKDYRYRLNGDPDPNGPTKAPSE